jgi:hypothetical protein
MRGRNQFSDPRSKQRMSEYLELYLYGIVGRYSLFFDPGIRRTVNEAGFDLTFGGFGYLQSVLFSKLTGMINVVEECFGNQNEPVLK